ncbi:hypothetical protein C2S51_017220 [Perilla frutescens var. frutescens]|nr:hypothetical protein C2S51_017220 [Perilla frutescens var. frutescens]
MKYYGGFFSGRVPVSPHDSRIWHRLQTEGIRAQQYISWSVRMDELHALCEFYDLSADFEDFLRSAPILWGERDAPRWNLTPHSEFCLTSAWECIRHWAPGRTLLADFWSDCLTPSISIFLWRLSFNHIPIDTKLLAREIPLEESVHAVWMHFSSWFHITPPHFTDISHVTERNDRKHRGRPFQSSHIIFQVTQHLHLLVLSGKLLPPQWASCYPQVHFMPVVKTVKHPLRPVPVSRQTSNLFSRGSSSFLRRLPMFGSSSTQRLWSQSSHLMLEARDNLGKSSPDLGLSFEIAMFESLISTERAIALLISMLDLVMRSTTYIFFMLRRPSGPSLPWLGWTSWAILTLGSGADSFLFVSYS